MGGVPPFHDSAADRWAAINCKLFMVRGATPGVDAYALIAAQVAAAKAAGGGIVYLPHIGGYTLSDTITIDASNIHLEIFDDIALTKTTKASAFLFTGAGRSARISNVSFRSPSLRRRVDGNGRSMTGYTYSTSDTYYSAVLFRWTDNWLCENVEGYSGLVNCLRAYQCGYGEFRSCHGEGAVYDNGITVDHDPSPSWSDTDPTSWSRAKIVDCSASNCLGFGISSYNATGVEIIRPRVWACGNDDALAPVTGGGISVEGDTGTAGNQTHDRRARIIKPEVSACYGSGLFIDSLGTKVEDHDIRGIIAPINRTDATTMAGSGIVVQAMGSLKMAGGTISSCGSHGVGMIAASVQGTDYFPSCTVDGVIQASASDAVYARGVTDLTVLPSADINGATTGYGVKVDNSGGASYNQGSGTVDVQPRRIKDATGNRAIDIQYVDTAYVAPALLKNCRSGQGGTGAQINIANCNRATHGSIRNEDANGKTGNIIQIASSCIYGGGSGLISGDYASSNSAINNNATNKLSPIAEGQQPYSLAYGATVTPNQKTMGTNIAIGMLTSGTTVAAAAGGPVAGDRITLQFTQDATGGRTVAWNAAYKNTTLVGAGTANQKARVSFEYDGSNWVQVSSTGWYS